MPRDGLTQLQAQRNARASRADQRLEPKRTNPGRGHRHADRATEVYTQFTAPVETLAHNPNNARDSYTEPEIDEMATSLAEQGQLQPLVVISRNVWLQHRPDDATKTGQSDYVVSLGNRRLAAARKAGMAELHVWLRDEFGADEDRFDEAMLAENIHRAALDPLLEAQALDRLRNKPGGSLRTVAERIGKSHGYVQQRLALLGLIPELRGALQENTLGFREARTLGTLETATQREVWLGGPPFTPPETTQADGDEDDAVNQVYRQPKADSQTKRRVTLPRRNPKKLAALLREHFTPDELAELRELLICDTEVDL